MELAIYVLPETVSFAGIAMEEVPSLEGTHQGYFDNVYFTNIWYHTVERGAGKWRNIAPDNYWNTDRAWMGDELPHEMPNGIMTFDLSQGAWSDGELVWDIPWGWAVKNCAPDTLPVKTMTTHYTQTFIIDESGTLSVSKLQNTVIRGTNNVIRLNGNVVQGRPVEEEEEEED